MVDYTPRLKLPRLDLAGGEIANGYPQVQNDLANLVDANAGAKICTSTTRPATPYQGQVIQETDTNRVLCRIGSKWIIIYQPVEEVVLDYYAVSGVPNFGDYAGDAANRIKLLVDAYQVRLVGIVSPQNSNVTGEMVLSGGGNYATISEIPDQYKPQAVPSVFMLATLIGTLNRYGLLQLFSGGSGRRLLRTNRWSATPSTGEYIQLSGSWPRWQ